MTPNRIRGAHPVVVAAFGAIMDVSVVGGLAGCNTIEGAAQDLEAAGEAVENTAEAASS